MIIRSIRASMRILACAFTAIMLIYTAGAQTTTATLGGVVTDPTGAVIPNATVLLKNEATGDTRTSVSNGAGVFSFSAVPTGNYDVTITAQGFQQFQQKAIHLDPGDQRNVRGIAMMPGAASQTVEVTSAESTISQDSGEQSALISSQEIEHLSVEGRDVTELLKILPGFAISNGGSGNVDNRQYDPAQVNPGGALGQYAANGTPANGQALLSDGMDITDPGNMNGAMQNVNYEQVAEVKVQTSSFTADQAHGPIVINTVGKSGGDKFHGNLYTFARTTQLNSTDWLAGYSGQGKPPDRYVYPGFTFGGPVLIPKTGFNKNKKLTFFVGAEDYAQRNTYAYGSASGATLTALVPTAGMRNGDFSQAQIQQYLGPAYGIDPNGGACTYNGSSSGYIPDANICRVPQTAPNGTALANGNIAPYLDPLGKVVMNEMPLPNTQSNGTYNWITTNLVNNNLWQAKGRVDFAISDKDKLFATYSTEQGLSYVPQNEYYSARGNLGGINVPGGGLTSKYGSHVASLNYTHIFSPSLTNEFFAGGGYVDTNFLPKTPSALNNNPYQGVFQNGSHVQPTLEDYGNDGLPLLRTPDATYGGIFAKKQIRIAGDNVTKVLGQHTLRTGLFYQWDSNPQVAPFINTNGTINQYYNPETFTDPVAGTIHSTGPVGSGNGGNYLANFAEGIVFQYNQTNIMPEPNLYFWNLSGYVQDHWRVSPRLSLDYGVRMEHITPWSDSHGVGIATFSPADYDAGANPSLPGVQWHGTNSSVPMAGRPTRWAFIEPRVGFALDLYGNGNSMLRGGFGIYRTHDAYNDSSNQSQTVIGSRTYTVNGPVLLSSISSFQSKVNTAAGFTPDTSVYAFDRTDDEEPRVRTYNLSLDQKLPYNTLMEISYVGNTSDKLINDGSTQNTTLDDLNALPVGSLFRPQPGTRPDTAGSAGTIYPVFGPASGGNNVSVSSLDQAHIDSFKRFPLYNHVYVPHHNAYSNYNGLQVGITRQTGKATYNVNYTWSKALGIMGIGGSSTYSYPADPFDYRNDYTYMPFDRSHIFNAAWSYDFGNIVKKRFVGGVTNGWQLSGVVQFQSGPNLPSTVNSNFGLSGSIAVPAGAVASVNGANTSTCATTSGTGTCTLSISNTNILGTPDVNLQPRVIANPAAHYGPHQYINGNAFTLPALGTNGAYRYGHVTGPAFFDTDLTAAKTFRISDRNNVQFRLAAFNFINHANNSFTSVNTQNYTMNFSQNSGSTDVNQALQAASAAANPQFGYAPLKEGRRIVELGLRYNF
ncbi:carboxypeptidase regulatory-like domain-containing protein [Occallatibacter savannae]|uniref:carboxypeptidase regulatory-like domain-containing protein n=1 Tax=Occallatibacter savannae TaxID=1002691 RepID=UPI000D685DFE|nr:carboxypeptidase regulatory-like domain-containing protein [Occallatibacter savannae]